jgi:hypothetical protein
VGTVLSRSLRLWVMSPEIGDTQAVLPVSG